MLQNLVWVVGQGVRRGDVNRRRSGRRRAGMAVERLARLKPLHRTKHGDGGAIDGIYRELSRDIGIYREISEAVDEAVGPVGEAKASTRDQTWRWAAGRMGGRGRQDGRAGRQVGWGEAKASTQNQAWRWADGRMGGGRARLGRRGELRSGRGY